LSEPHDVICGLECRADNFIVKPYDEDHLVSRVQLVLLDREVRQSDHAGMGVEIFFHGQKHFITADRLQILNLLLSTYEAATQRNKELTRAKDDLHELYAKLETANKDLESFSYSVSHDLRAPLRAIDGFSGLLLQGFAEQIPAEAQRLLNTIGDSARHMSALIDGLLNFSRFGRHSLSKTNLNVDKLVKQILDERRAELEQRSIEVKVGTLPDCFADLTLLKQVFINLISNAIKYTRQREKAFVEVDCRDENGEKIYFVRDNGAGFDMRYAGKLFGVFQRLHRDEEFEGTGVGLSIVHRIIQRHGGRIWAEGEVDKGATFYFTLPRQGAE
jgi:light-regulated signal transduction histidine kinase (bacteriophytochrome)